MRSSCPWLSPRAKPFCPPVAILAGPSLANQLRRLHLETPIAFADVVQRREKAKPVDQIAAIRQTNRALQRVARKRQRGVTQQRLSHRPRVCHVADKRVEGLGLCPEICPSGAHTCFLSIAQSEMGRNDGEGQGAGEREKPNLLCMNILVAPSVAVKPDCHWISFQQTPPRRNADMLNAANSRPKP